MMDMWTGVVEDRQDPLMLGRCRVRVFGIHDINIQDIPTNDLPWAYPVMPLTSASISGIGDAPVGPVEGTHVVGFWRDGSSQQQPVMIGTLPGVPEDAPNTSNPEFAGLQSPLENYPKTGEDTDGNIRGHGLNESDTSRLARYRYPVEGEDGKSSEEGVCEECKTETIVQKKLDERVLNVAVANDHGFYSEPPTKFNPKYPLNHVRVSESGHVFEVDDTPQSERLHTYHSSGTFEEIYPFGTKVTKVVRDNYEFVLGDQYVNIKKLNPEGGTFDGGNLFINIEGDVFEKVNGNVERQINGSVREVIGGNFHTHVNGDRTITTEGSKAEKCAGDVTTEQYNRMDHTKGKCWENIDGEKQTSSNNSITMRSSGGNISLDALGNPLGNIGVLGEKSGNININSSGFVQTTAGTKVGLQSKGGNLDFNAGPGALSIAAVRGLNIIGAGGPIVINAATAIRLVAGGTVAIDAPVIMVDGESFQGRITESTAWTSPSWFMAGKSMEVFYDIQTESGVQLNSLYDVTSIKGQSVSINLSAAMKVSSVGDQIYKGRTILLNC